MTEWLNILVSIACGLVTGYFVFILGRLSGFNWAWETVMKEWKELENIEWNNDIEVQSNTYAKLAAKLLAYYNLPFFYWRKR